MYTKKREFRHRVIKYRLKRSIMHELLQKISDPIHQAWPSPRGWKEKKNSLSQRKKNTIMQKNKHRQPRGKIKGINEKL